MEAPPGFEPGVKDLQSHALPLGYGAVVGRRSLHFSFRRRAKPIGEKFRIRSRLPPLKSKTMFCICFRVRYVSLYEFRSLRNRKMERATRLELATSTLARWRSTG